MRTWAALDVRRADSETDDLIQALLTDFGIAAIDDTGPDVSRVFFNDAGERDRAAAALHDRFPAVDVRSIDVPDQDWATRSQASLRAIQVGGIVVAPPWDLPSSGIRDSGFGIRTPEPIVIVIQPSMGFGTGHHATTRLCLAALQQIDLRGRTVIDVGTGSGVLAIAARRLGAEAVLGIDDDADAVAAAEANVELNGESWIALQVADVRASPIGRFDVVIANLTGGLLIAAAAQLRSFATQSGWLVLSGFMDREKDEVLRAFGTCLAESLTREDEWMCAVLEFPPHRE